MMDRLTPQQSRQLAAFVATLRRDWDRPGIEAALAKARDLAPAGDVSVAAVRAAGITTNQSPAVIPLPGAHWRESEKAPYFPPAPPHERCSVCGRSRLECVSRPHSDHPFEPDIRPAAAVPADDQLQTLRTRLQAATSEFCTHGVRPDHCNEHKPAREPAEEHA